ncbi:MAG: hypothetical protein OXM61_06340 [Candidatus Poribacteria bacterium]|nr:hypothetical protein [Candidatus Poribacteria bacterium]
MQSSHGITALAFRLKCFKLLFLVALSTTILTGCERRLVSPIDPTDPSRVDTQFAQKALSDLADTAAERGFADLANAANEVAEVLAIETGTVVETAFWKLAQEATALEQAFVKAACKIELRQFAIASVYAAKAHVTETTVNEEHRWRTLLSLLKAYPAEEPSDMKQALQNLAHEAVTAEKTLQLLPAENTFIPFTFGYGIGIDSYADYADYYSWNPNPPSYEPGVILIQYDKTIRPVTETKAAVIEFVTNKIIHKFIDELNLKDLKDDGYAAVIEFLTNMITVTTEGVSDLIEAIDFGVEFDPRYFMEELITIPGVALVQPKYYYYDSPLIAYPPPPISVQIIDAVRTKYNEAWCQGNFDVMDKILIKESGLDFFDYAFVRNLADIYAEEVPEDANLIQTNGFSLRPIGITFLTIYFQHSGKTLDEIIEIFRQTVRNRNMGIETVTIKHSHYHL